MAKLIRELLELILYGRTVVGGRLLLSGRYTGEIARYFPAQLAWFVSFVYAM